MGPRPPGKGACPLGSLRDLLKRPGPPSPVRQGISERTVADLRQAFRPRTFAFRQRLRVGFASRPQRKAGVSGSPPRPGGREPNVPPPRCPGGEGTRRPTGPPPRKHPRPFPARHHPESAVHCRPAGPNPGTLPGALGDKLPYPAGAGPGSSTPMPRRRRDSPPYRPPVHPATLSASNPLNLVPLTCKADAAFSRRCSGRCPSTNRRGVACQPNVSIGCVNRKERDRPLADV